MIATNAAAWQTESLRHTTFLHEPIDPTQQDFWRQLVDKHPEQKITRENERLSIEEGTFSSGRLSVDVRGDRIDWRMTFSQNSGHAELPTMGPYEEISTVFEDLLKGWPPLCPPTNRIAYGAVLLCPAPDLNAASSLIQNMMPMNQFDFQDATDFLFRINRRRTIQQMRSELSINRISTWSIANVSRILVDVSSSNTTKITTSDDACVCRLELDINTVPNPNVELDNHALAQLFSQLVELANEIASQGDIL